MKSEYQASGIAAEPFNDCARTPGLAAAPENRCRLTGRLAVYGLLCPAGYRVDLVSGAGWQVPFHAEALEWAPTGSMTLAAPLTLKAGLITRSGAPPESAWEAHRTPPAALAVAGKTLVGQDTLEIPARRF